MDRVFPKSLEQRWNDPRGLIQVFTGPRQVGKTTAALSLMDKRHTVYASADLPTPPMTSFIIEHWQQARAIPSPKRTLILDEIQKIPRWSETVKHMWDEDQREKNSMRVCLLGSSAILIERGLSESLTGRFEMNYFPHWTFGECKTCFKTTLSEYILIGGYPKAYDLRDDLQRTENYIRESILEPTLGRDILALHAVDKPALMRQLFWYVSRLPAHIVSYEKILGHLQGKGNSATIVGYAELLSLAFLIQPLSKFSPHAHRTKRSIPKWIILNPALVETGLKKEGATGFVFENLVGSHILNILFGQKQYELHYWREEDWEIDFILAERGEPVLAFEVKSGRGKKIPSLDVFKKKGVHCPVTLVSQDNILDFLRTTSVEELKIIST